MPLEYPLLDSCDPRTCANLMIKSSSRVIDGIFRKHLTSFDLSSSQLSMLFVVAKSGQISQVEMTDKLMMDKSTVSRNLRRLLKYGLLEKCSGRKICITNRGKSLVERVIPAWEQANAEVKDLLGRDGSEALHLLMQKLAMA